VAALIAAGAVLATNSGVFTPSHPVPELTGKSLSQAEQAVIADHFKVRTTGYASSISVPAGIVLSQRPRPRSGHPPVTMKQGSTIDLVLSNGLPKVKIPSLQNVVGCVQAVQVLARVHLRGVCPASVAEYSVTVQAAAIIKTVPGITAPYNSQVIIVASKGRAPVVVPTVPTTSTYATAATALSRVGFVPSQTSAYSSTVPVGHVITTDPAPTAGPQPYGSTVKVVVSIGPEPVKVPDEAGKSVKAATRALEDLGLRVAGPYGPPGSKQVFSTKPAQGTSVLPGTTVSLYTQ
jgi:beta-lactam-binding protein with PASTA domain